MNAKAKVLFGNILPALGGLFVTYLYNVVNGIFVGRGVGAAALGAVNIDHACRGADCLASHGRRDRRRHSHGARRSRWDWDRY